MQAIKFETPRESVNVRLSGARRHYKLECSFRAIGAARFFNAVEAAFVVERVKNEDDGTSIVLFTVAKQDEDTIVEKVQEIVERTLDDYN